MVISLVRRVNYPPLKVAEISVSRKCALFLMHLTSHSHFGIHSKDVMDNEAMDNEEHIFHINYLGMANPQIHREVHMSDHSRLYSDVAFMHSCKDVRNSWSGGLLNKGIFPFSFPLRGRISVPGNCSTGSEIKAAIQEYVRADYM